MDTRDIESKLTAYADGELSETDASEVAAYLRDNPAAQLFVETQRTLRNTLQTKAEPQGTPQYVRQRVVDQIATTPSGIRGIIRDRIHAFRLGIGPSFALLVVTIIAVVSAVGSIGAKANAPVVRNSVTITGEIRCIDCAVAHQWGVNSECEKYGHRNGIVTADGTMWTVKHSDQWAPYVHDTSLWGTKVVAKGHECGAAHYVDIHDVEFAIPAATEISLTPIIGQ